MFASRNDKSSYVLLEELWNEQTNSFYSGTAIELLNLLGNKSGTTIEEITALANQTKKASDLRTNTYKKKNTQDINVMLGGLEWTVCYLSTDKNGDPILTLWLSNSTQDKFYGRAKDEGDCYGFYQGGLYSLFSSGWATGNDAKTDALDYPGSMYGTSYIRVVTLNNGGKYATSDVTLSQEYQPKQNSVFANFTLEGDDHSLTNYIVKPKDVAWQENQSAIDYGFSYNRSNDSWAVQDDNGFNVNDRQNYNYSTKLYYDEWKNDYIWLPSATEIGVNLVTTSNNSIWGMSMYQKANYDGKTTQVDESIGKNRSIRTGSVLRTASWVDLRSRVSLVTSGASESGDYTYLSAGVRPALHLNLKSVAESLEKENLYTLNYNYEIANEDYLQVGVYPTCMGVTDEFSLTNPVCSGYKFLGWRVENGLNSETAKYGTSSATESIVDENTECSVGNSKKMYFSGLGVSGGTVTLKALWQSTGEISVIYKSYNDYFTDYNISKSTITEDDLIGTGTSTDPYIVKTTKGFLYLTNKAVSGIDLSQKYIELECDVILNEETFDESGEPKTGDGVVYSWEPINNASSASVDGRGHTIYGLYYNNIEATEIALFGANSTLKKIKNINSKSLFIKAAKGCATFAIMVDEAEKCSASSGTILNSIGYTAGVVLHVIKAITYCENYVNITGNNVGGIIAYAKGSDTKLNNLVNFGNVTGETVGGIASHVGYRIEMKNCINYGNIFGSFASGIISRAPNGAKSGTLIDCIDYGNIYGSSQATSFFTIAYDGVYKLIRCKSYANISGRGACSILFTDASSYQAVHIEIFDFEAKMNQSICVIYGISDWRFATTLKVENLYVEYDTESLPTYGGIILYYKGSRSTVSIKNAFIKVKVPKFSSTLFTNVDYASNILLIVDAEDFTQKNNYLFSGNAPHLAQSILINIKSKTSQVKHYYGTNFRDFYVSWKYGTIGLKTLDGVGSAQGSITTTWLEENGWVKKG